LVSRCELGGMWRATGIETPQRGHRWRGYCKLPPGATCRRTHLRIEKP